MDFINAQAAIGDTVRLARTNPAHLGQVGNVGPDSKTGSFEEMLLQALNGVNDLQQMSDQLGQQMIINPDSVDTHDVTIAMAQANLAVSLTKAVVDGALQAYSNIINIR